MSKRFSNKPASIKTTRILYRNGMDMAFFGFVTCYLRNIKNCYAEAFRAFRDNFDVEYEQYGERRCYYLMYEMSDEHREFARTELKKLKAENNV